MTTNHDQFTLSLADLDRLLPLQYTVLTSDDPRNADPHALRTVWNDTSVQTHSFTSAQAYLQFVVSIASRDPFLAEEGGTRYLLLSASYDADPYFQASVTHTVAALTRTNVTLHRMKSDETSVRFVLTSEEIAALITGLHAYQADGEREEAASPGEVDPFLADVTAEPES